MLIVPKYTLCLILILNIVVLRIDVCLNFGLLDPKSLCNLSYFDMCTNKRWFTSKYTKRSFLISCGRCEACLQEKAASRSQRIRNHSYSDSSRIPLFVSLTYDRSSCPYIKKEDLYNEVDILPVYREFTFRRKRCFDGEYRVKRFYKETVLTQLFAPDYHSSCFVTSDGVKHRFIPFLKHRRNKIGVCYFKDIQDFEKRLRSNLKRKYNYNEKFSFYQCSEYGETTLRPHFHVLMYIRPQDEALFKHAICEAWPLADRNRTKRYIEFCHDDAAGYVSSYVNCGSKFPRFLAENFKPKHSHSKLFGLGLKSFQLSEILKKVDEGSLRYFAETSVDGVRQVLSLPIPKYVINRFFPKFKGYSRLTGDEVRFFLSDCERFTDLFRFQGNDIGVTHRVKFFVRYNGFEPEFCETSIVKNWLVNSHYVHDRDLNYSLEDCFREAVRLNHAYDIYHVVTGKNRFDFAIDFERVWRCYNSTVLRSWYEDDKCHVAYKYDNIFSLIYDPGLDTVLYDKISNSKVKLFLDPNDFPQNINKTSRLVKAYHSYLKTKSVNNAVLSQYRDDV